MSYSETLAKHTQDALDGFFQFKPGDMVCMRAHLKKWQTEWELNGYIGDEIYGKTKLNAPPVVTVITRLLEECHGNLQGFYTIRVDGVDNPVRVMDHELAPYEEMLEISRQMKDARDKYHAEQEGRRHAWRDSLGKSAVPPGHTVPVKEDE